MAFPGKRTLLYAAASLVLTWILACSFRGTLLLTADTHSTKIGLVSRSFSIKDKVATITDTSYTPYLIPLILHFRGVLGPSWPIVFYTSQKMYDEHLSNNATKDSPSAAWRYAVADGSIDVRILPSKFDLTNRKGVNMYLVDTWLWEQLAPAKHVLVFQADAMLCGNANQTVDDFLEYDFIGAPLHPTMLQYNGGLSLRNRNMLLDILRSGRDWESDFDATGTEYYHQGEDIWLSVLMRERGGNMPSIETALQFAKELPWHFKTSEQPIGYHKVAKVAKEFVPLARKLCPELDLSTPGLLGG